MAQFHVTVEEINSETEMVWETGLFEKQKRYHNIPSMMD